MKITVETDFTIGGNLLDSETVNCEVQLSERATVRDLLEELSRKRYERRMTFIEALTGEVDSRQFLIMVNGADLKFLPQRLETGLKDGDKVSITEWLDLLGGG